MGNKHSKRSDMNTLEQYIDTINKALDDLHYPQTPDQLYAPIRYELSLGGKRIRPVLTLMACEMFGGDYRHALMPAMGVEIFHNFTLLHDDVMDKADMRRGKPTVHRVWDENTAILSGDAMQILAYAQIAKAPASCLKEVIDIFSNTALEICEGQQFDMEFESRTDVTEEEYIKMIRLKTAVLLGGALKIGAVIAETTHSNADKLYRFGENIGLAFQLKDDYLDVYGDPRIFGKNIGGDILNNKKTFMLISAKRLAKDADSELLQQWIEAKEFDPSEKIRQVTGIYDRSGIKNLCEEKMFQYYNEAIQSLQSIDVDESNLKPLLNLAAWLMDREN